MSSTHPPPLVMLTLFQHPCLEIGAFSTLTAWILKHVQDDAQ